jgi:hypothetical protein
MKRSVFVLVCFMVLSVASYKQRMRGLDLEVENKSAKPVLQKGSEGSRVR